MFYFEEEKNENPFVSVNTLIQPKDKSIGAIHPYFKEKQKEEDTESLADDLSPKREVTMEMESKDIHLRPSKGIPKPAGFMKNLAGISRSVEKINAFFNALLQPIGKTLDKMVGLSTNKADMGLGKKSGYKIVKNTEEKKETSAEKARPTFKASKKDNYELELRKLLTLDMPYMGEGYDYSWLEKKKEKLIESGAADFMTSSLKGGSLISDFLLSLGWEVMDSLADQDISPSKKKLINQAIYEWNIRVNNNYISIMDFTMNAGKIKHLDKALLNSVNIFTQSVINTVLETIDKGICGGIPLTSTLLSPELPKYEKGDAMLKMIVLYKYNDSATKDSTLNFGSFGQGQSWIDKIFHNVPCESIKNYYVMTIEMQLRDNKIIDATWSLTEYYYYQLNREFKPIRSIKIP